MKRFFDLRQATATAALFLTAAALIGFSDYLAVQRAALDHAQEKAERVSFHLRDNLPAAALAEPSADGDRRGSIAARLRRSVADLGFGSILIIDPVGTVLGSAVPDEIGARIVPPEGLERSLAGEVSSRIVRRGGIGGDPGVALFETLTPLRIAGADSPGLVCVVRQDYRPIRRSVLRDASRSGLTHLLLLLVFSALFFRYGRFTGHALEKRHRDLIDDLESRLLEKTLELEKSSQRMGDLLGRRQEAYRDLMISDEYKQNFIGLVSHELRTPLTVVKGYLSLLASGVIHAPEGEAAAEALDASLRETRKLESIINNILELGRLDRGLLKVVPETFGMRELAQEAVDLVDSEMADRKAIVRVEVAQEAATFTTDRLMLLQVAYQYLSNAVKFSPPGGMVGILARPGHRGLVLSVRDEGPGIPESLSGDIFDLFYQVDISSTRSHEGSGLGLAIVRRIASILGGRAWVESEPGRGSTFYFEAPAMVEPAPPASAEEGSRSPQPRAHAADRPAGSILVVDDDEDFRDLVRHLLQTRGYAVEVARDGLDALNRLFGAGSHPPALVLLDVRMPYVNGLDVCRIIRRSVLTREIPVIMVSALATEADLRAGHDSGANAYFTKPFDPDELTTRIGFLLGAATGART